jgi:hypothetical protein
MTKIVTLVTYLDAPEFQGYLEQDAKRLAVALERMGTARDGREK